MSDGLFQIHFVFLLLSTVVDHQYIYLSVHSHDNFGFPSVNRMCRTEEDLKDMTSTSSVNSTSTEKQSGCS